MKKVSTRAKAQSRNISQQKLLLHHLWVSGASFGEVHLSGQYQNWHGHRSQKPITPPEYELVRAFMNVLYLSINKLYCI